MTLKVIMAAANVTAVKMRDTTTGPEGSPPKIALNKENRYKAVVTKAISPVATHMNTNPN